MSPFVAVLARSLGTNAGSIRGLHVIRVASCVSRISKPLLPWRTFRRDTVGLVKTCFSGHGLPLLLPFFSVKTLWRLLNELHDCGSSPTVAPRGHKSVPISAITGDWSIEAVMCGDGQVTLGCTLDEGQFHATSDQKAGAEQYSPINENSMRLRTRGSRHITWNVVAITSAARAQESVPMGPSVSTAANNMHDKPFKESKLRSAIKTWCADHKGFAVKLGGPGDRDGNPALENFFVRNVGEFSCATMKEIVWVHPWRMECMVYVVLRRQLSFLTFGRGRTHIVPARVC